MEEEDLIRCPCCNQTDYIIERDLPVSIIISWFGISGPVIRDVKFFCTYCKKDF